MGTRVHFQRLSPHLRGSATGFQEAPFFFKRQPDTDESSFVGPLSA